MIENKDRLPGCDFPQTRSAITTSRRQVATIRAEGDIVHIAALLETQHLFLGRDVPEPCGPIAARRRDPNAIGRKACSRYRTMMGQRGGGGFHRRDKLLRLTSQDIPDPRRA